ncbi:TPA: hypothetical protein ACN976_003013 [Vibrio campbellii]
MKRSIQFVYFNVELHSFEEAQAQGCLYAPSNRTSAWFIPFDEVVELASMYRDVASVGRSYGFVFNGQFYPVENVRQLEKDIFTDDLKIAA